jgi:hypothetical protein
MWRRLLRRVHPDAGGDGELFVWVRELQEHVAEDAIEPPRREHIPSRRSTPADSSRVPYEEAFGEASAFDELTRRALALAGEARGAPEPHASLLMLLFDCYAASEIVGVVYRQQLRGATYRQLAAIGHGVGMSKSERVEWYRICESIPLSQRHATHILDRLQERRVA